MSATSATDPRLCGVVGVQVFPFKGRFWLFLRARERPFLWFLLRSIHPQGRRAYYLSSTTCSSTTWIRYCVSPNNLAPRYCVSPKDAQGEVLCFTEANRAKSYNPVENAAYPLRRFRVWVVLEVQPGPAEAVTGR